MPEDIYYMVPLRQDTSSTQIYKENEIKWRLQMGGKEAFF